MNDTVDIIYIQILKHKRRVCVTCPAAYKDGRHFVHVGSAARMGNLYAVLRPVMEASVSNKTGGLALYETENI